MQFEVEGKKLEVSPISFNSLVELTKLFEKVSSENAGKTPVQILTGVLQEVDDFMCNLVFRKEPDAKNINWGEVDYEVIDPIISFFLAKNPTLKKRLVELMKSLGLDLTQLTDGLRNIR